MPQVNKMKCVKGKGEPTLTDAAGADLTETDGAGEAARGALVEPDALALPLDLAGAVADGLGLDFLTGGSSSSDDKTSTARAGGGTLGFAMLGMWKLWVSRAKSLDDVLPRW